MPQYKTLAHGLAHQRCIELSSQLPVHSRRSATAQKFHWKDGDIAFLRHHREFTPLERHSLIETGYMPPMSTGHPVIILNRRSEDATHVAITTVSAFSADKFSRNLAPWNNAHHYGKSRHDFRSFCGSECPDKNQKDLHLEGGKLMPKTQTSWVYIQNVYVVPITTLKKFVKPPTRLRMTEQSLSDLCNHMVVANQDISNVLNDPRLDHTFSHEPINPDMVGTLQRTSSVHFQQTRPPNNTMSNKLSNASMGNTSQIMAPPYFPSTGFSHLIYPNITPLGKMPTKPYLHDTGFNNPQLGVQIQSFENIIHI